MPVIPAVITAGASLIGGAIASKGAKSAANAAAASTDAATQEQRRQYDTSVELLRPTSLAGADAKARQMLMLGYSPDAVKKFIQDSYGSFSNLGYGGGTGTGGTGTGGAGGGAAPDTSWVDSYNPQSFLESQPGYQFGVDQGSKALQKSAAARGALFSGATGKALTKFGNDYGSGYWDKLFGDYGQLAGEGSNATGQVINIGQHTTDAIGNNLIAGGAARASGYADAGRILGGALGYAGGTLGSWAANGWKLPNTTPGFGLGY